MPHKIDLTSHYPCPCRRQANLVPITLTEAFGCEHCQNIFVVAPSGEEIEQVSGAYAVKRLWCWNGSQWNAVYPPQDGIKLLLSTLVLILPLLGLMLVPNALGWLAALLTLGASLILLLILFSALRNLLRRR